MEAPYAEFLGCLAGIADSGAIEATSVVVAGWSASAAAEVRTLNAIGVGFISGLDFNSLLSAESNGAVSALESA
jgi:hypothetical protein